MNSLEETEIVAVKNKNDKYNVSVNGEMFVVLANTEEDAIVAYEASIVPIEEDLESIVADNLQYKTNNNSRASLADTDWKVIRELERKYLAGTPLNTEREALRSAVIDNTGE